LAFGQDSDCAVHNDPMVIRDASAALRALRSGGLDAVIGLRECAWLDAKEQPYKLGHPAQDAELRKDTAALANVNGGLVLIGYGTARRGGREVLDRLAPVPANRVNLEQYRMILRSCIYPDVRGLEIEWLPANDQAGVLAIYVPRQREADKLFVIRGHAAREGVRVPVRDDDGTRWLEPEAVQRLISGGWNALENTAVLSLLEMAHRRPAIPREPLIAIGQGVPGYKAAFEDAYRRAGGKAILASPVDEVTNYGPGAAQSFRGGPRGAPAFLCAVPGQPAVAVAAPVWEELAGLGGGVARGGGLPAAGFPVAERTGDGGHATMIAADATDIPLDGGSWGAGLLKRPDPRTRWSWEPVPQTDFNIWHSNRWTVQAPTDLQIRAIASLPWVTDPPLKVGIRGRQRLIEALAGSELSAWTEELSIRRGAALQAKEWAWATGQGTWQSDRSAHCRMTVAGPGDLPALTAEVMTQVPDGLHLSAVLGVAEIRLNFQPWAAALTAAGATVDRPEALRLTVHELASFFTVAWATATMLAPQTAVPSPQMMPPAGPPRVEFEFKVSPYHESTPSTIQLNDVIDLTAFGSPTSDSHRRQGGFGITAPLNLPADQRRAMLEEQLAGMAQSWGYIYADPDMLRAAAS
jgi:hypothetical protein